MTLLQRKPHIPFSPSRSPSFPPCCPSGPRPAHRVLVPASPPPTPVRTHVKAKKRVVAPTRKMAAAETGTYLLGLNLFPDAAGMLELWRGVRPTA